MDYRKQYAERYGITIPEGFDIHHVDLDHNNNDIDNLLMLPHDVHMKLHESINSHLCSAAQSVLMFKWGTIPAQCTYLSHYLTMYAKVYEALEYWASAKSFEELRVKGYDGYMPTNYKAFRDGKL